MKIQLVTGLLVLVTASSLLALDKTEVQKDMLASMFNAFGGKEPNLGDLDSTKIEKFQKALEAIKSYADENSKNLLGMKDSVINKAAAEVVRAGKDLTAIVGGIIGTRTEKGLIELRRMLEREEEKVLEAQSSLIKAKFTLSNKKSAHDVLHSTIESLRALIKKATSFASKRIEALGKADGTEETPPLPTRKPPPLPKK